MAKPISGFSKLTKSEKIKWLCESYFPNNSLAKKVLEQYWNSDQKLQKLHDEFIENTVSNYYLPLGIAPNFKINETLLAIPMAIEESSVVAAASNAAKFWLDKGGFKTEVLSTTKSGQVHFNFIGDTQALKNFFDQIKLDLLEDCKSLTASMEKRGGGILSLELVDKTEVLEDYFQLDARFETMDAMGANFINSCLEQLAKGLESRFNARQEFTSKGFSLQVVMSILSNYVPQCIVRAQVNCPINSLETEQFSGEEFAQKFVRAVAIANADVKRAVTHNKGIMNGVDAVILATGNDFRAVEAGVHAYASRSGNYKSLSNAKIENDQFVFWIEIPLALGTVGGLTKLHPLVRLNLELLGQPSARQLMEVVAVAGLAQNFAAVRSLVTTGIQKGHMKMHLKNILNSLDANKAQKLAAIEHFKTNAISQASVKEFIQTISQQ